MDREVLYELAAEEEQEPLETELDASLRVLGTRDYEDLDHKPSIEGVTLTGDRSFRQLGLDILTEAEIDRIIFGGDA